MNELHNGQIELTDEQRDAISFVYGNLSLNKSNLVAIAGPAGSGKTTLIHELTSQFKQPVTVSAMTNKATNVLRAKGLWDAVTLHQACMRPIFNPPVDKIANFLGQVEIQEKDRINYPKELVDEYGQEKLEAALQTTKSFGVCAGLRALEIKDVFSYIKAWMPAAVQDGLLIIDEASMLGETELGIAQQVFGKIVLVGDQYQLSPVKSTPVFWNVKDRYALETVHRQAAESQPLKVATAVRNGERVAQPPVLIDIDLCRDGMPVIVWRNATRLKLTEIIRREIGYHGLSPQPGEQLICRNGADRNAKMRGLFNNSMWRVIDADGFKCVIENDVGDQLVEDVYMEELEEGDGVPFRFAYALTCHNAQGSEWPTVMVHHADAAAHFGKDRDEARKWLYTAVTRAKHKVMWVTEGHAR